MTCFIDTSAWMAIIDKNHEHHNQAQQYFEELLDKNAKIVSNNQIIDETVNNIRNAFNAKKAREYLNIIDESIMTINLRMDWISRRVRRNALNQLLKTGESNLELKHFFIQETIKRKKVDVIFSFDARLKYFGLPLMPPEIH